MWPAIRLASAKGRWAGAVVDGKAFAAARGFATDTRRILLPRVHANSPLKAVFVRKSIWAQQPVRGFAAAKEGSAKKPAAAKKAPTKAKKAASKAAVAARKKKAAAAAKAKAKAKAKAAAAKKKKPLKELTPDEKKKLKVRELKKVALLDEPSKLPEHPWILYVIEQTKGTKGAKGQLTSTMSDLSRSFKALPQLELQRLRDTTDKNRAANAAAYKAWVESHPAASIAEANRARLHLTRLLGKTKRKIKDDRLPKRPQSAYTLYTKSRWTSGAYDGHPFAEASKTLSVEWKNLSPAEREPFANEAKLQLETYRKEAQKPASASP